MELNKKTSITLFFSDSDIEVFIVDFTDDE